MKTNIQIASEKARAVYMGGPPLMKQICQVHGLTLREFARIFEMSKSHAEDIWNQVRFPSLPEAIQIARYFEVTVEELFGWRLDDNGDRRPLLVEDPKTGKVVRLNRNNELQSALALVRARQRTPLAGKG